MKKPFTLGAAPHSLLKPATFKLVMLTAACLSAPVLAADPQPRVVGGSNASAGQFPWQAAIITDDADPLDSLVCGGSIIHANWILTAAHCYVAENPADFVVVSATDLAETTDAQIIAVKRWIVHSQYVPDAASAGEGDTVLDNDIALIELETPIDFTACGTACAAIEPVISSNESTLAGISTQATVSGWGDTVAGDPQDDDYFYPPDLQWANLNIVSCTASPSLYESSQISSRMMCAGASDYSKDSCAGDSGGPLVVANNEGTGYKLAGIVSWGTGCAEEGFPGVYTRVSRFSDWISTKTNGACCTETDMNPLEEAIINDSHGSGGGGGGALPMLLLTGLLGLPLLTRRRKQPFREQA